MSNLTAWQTKVKESLQPVVHLAHTLLGMPLAIWLRKEPRSQYMAIFASVGITTDYLNKASSSLRDGSVISEVFETRQEQLIQNTSEDGRFSNYVEFAQEGWGAVKILPIASRQEEALGVVELFASSSSVFEQSSLPDKLSQLIAIISTTVEGLHESYNAERLAEIVREFNKTPSIEKATQLVAKYARELTGADSSIIFLFNPDSERFSIGARSPDLEWEPRLPRLDGLTRGIINAGTLYQCDDTNGDTEECKRAEKARGREDARSLIGIPLQLKTEKLGVLYIRGQHPNQFNQQDIHLLQVLADRASMALGLARFLLKPNTEVEQAISGLSGLMPLLETICEEVKEQQGFDYAALQLVDPEEQTIATVAGKYADHIPKGWTGVARHSLEAATEVRDIQADIVLSNPPQIEIITGWDNRFDRWIYDEFKHQHYARIYVPIVLVGDINGETNENWFYEIPKLTTEISKDDESGYHSTIKVNLSNQFAEGTKFEIIGTLEAGYYVPNASIQELKGKIVGDQAIKLFRFATEKALAIRKKLLPYALETVAKGAKQILKADSADLHFRLDERWRETGGYVYQVCTGKRCRRLLESHWPRYEDPNSLGQLAIGDKKPKFIPDPAQGHGESALETFNKPAFDDGIRATVAFPLFVGDKHGVLYVHFRNTHWFNDDEIGWVENFANNATTAIRDAINYKQIRDNADTLTTLHSIVQSLANKPKDDLLRHIAGNTINVFGADVVTVYEYSEIKGDFVPQPQKVDQKDSDFPVKVGRLFLEEVKITYLDEHCGPKELIKWGKDKKDNVYYASNTKEDPVMSHKDRKPREDGCDFFVIRERFQSSLGILLKVGQEVVGAMFVHYRRSYSFPKEDRKVVEIMASAAAIAIKNRRREVISEDFRKIITTTSLDELLKLIVKQAVEITNANVGEIRLLEGPPNDQKLVSKALHPEAKHLPEWNSSKLDVGITGWVACNKKARLVPDVSKEPVYIKFFSDLEVKSELCVPLLDKDENVLGTLLVDSVNDSVNFEKFTERDKRVLQVLADQAVIGIQNARRQKQLADTTTVTLLGSLASQILHRVNNDVGAIQQFSKLLSSDREEDKKRIGRVSELAKNVLTEINQLRIFSVHDETQMTNLKEVISESLTKVEIPNTVVRNIPEISNDVLILGSKSHLTEVFVNLIQNAIDAMPGSGKLSITVTKNENEKNRWIIVAVNDTGEGIPEQNLPDKIFSFGFTTKQKENDKKGLGMGLWWTKMYVERLGGRIDVENLVGGGTRFVVTLPFSVLEEKKYV